MDDWKRLERFLILGNEGGSYYATERALTIENAQGVVSLPERRCGSSDPDNRRDQRLGAGAEERSRDFRAGDRRGDGTFRSSHGAAQCLPHGHAPVSVRRGGRGVPGVGPWSAQGHRRLVRDQGRRFPGVPGCQVSAAQRLVAPRPVAVGAPGHGRSGPPGGLPLGCRRQGRRSGRERSSGAIGRSITRMSRRVCPGSWPRWMKRRRWIDRGLSP